MLRFILRDASFKARSTRSLLMSAVEIDGMCLEYAAPQLQDDLEIVCCAVEQDGAALQVASDRLRANPTVVIVAVTGCASGCAFQSAAAGQAGISEK